ncbi:MAG: hypothetical protein JWN77_1354 [Frankiales bacterium]|nr:hypothetical protein [Frankiales bacterium]
MTAPQQVAGTAKDEAANVAGTTAQQASQVAGAASTAAADVAGTAKAEAANVLGESLDQAKDLAETVRAQVAEQLSSQGDRLTETLRGLSTQLSDGDTSGVVGQVLKEAGTRVQAFADYAERTGPQGLVTELRQYAKRNPGTFLLGAALAGLVAGRVVKGVSANKQQQSSTPELPAAPLYGAPIGGTATGNPLAGVTAPEGTGSYAGYVPSPEPSSTYAPEPVVAYPPAPLPASTPYDAPSYSTSQPGGPT